MDATFILRNTPIEGDAEHAMLLALCPRKIIYTVDLGGLPVFRTRMSESGRDALGKKMRSKIDEVMKIAPFKEATEVCPIIPSHLFSGKVTEELRTSVVVQALGLFADVKKIYFDLGVDVDLESVIAMLEPLRKLREGVSIGLIASISEYAKENGLLELSGEPDMFPCPFLAVGTGLRENLEEAKKICGTKAEVFCAFLNSDDARDFHKILADFDMSLFVFWSAFAAKGVEFPGCAEKEEPKNGKVMMTALFTSVIRDRRSMDSGVIGNVNVGEKSTFVRVYPPDKDGTSFGQITLEEGGVGYVVVKHFNQEKFSET